MDVRWTILVFMTAVFWAMSFLCNRFHRKYFLYLYDTVYWDKRRGHLTSYTCHATILMLMFGTPLRLAVATMVASDVLPPNSLRFAIPQQLSFVVHSLLIASILILFATRVFMAWFDAAWTQVQIDNHQWKAIINPRHFPLSNSWIVTERGRWGNYIWIKFKLPLIVCVYTCIILMGWQISAWVTPHWPGHFLVAIFLLIPPSISLPLSRQLPENEVSNRYGVRKEMVSICILLIVCMSVHLLLTVSLCIIADYYMSEVIESFILAATLFVFVRWQTIRVCTVIDREALPVKAELTATIVESVTKTFTTSLSGGKNLPKSRSQKLKYILSDLQSLEVFMAHCAKEGSVTNILAFIEITQFQSNLLTMYPDDASIDVRRKQKWSTDTPKSTIVHNTEWLKSQINNIDETLQERIMMTSTSMTTLDGPSSSTHNIVGHKIEAYHLYHKYCALGAENEIVSVSRTELLKLEWKLHDLESLLTNDYGYDIIDGRRHKTAAVESVGQLCTLFDPIIDELWYTMKNSFSHFKTTTAYRHFSSDNGFRARLELVPSM